jgi:malic enzyme
MGEPLSPAEEALRDAANEYHRSPTRGKISVTPTKPLSNQRDLSLAYSPGVAYPCLAIQADPNLAAEYTARGNLVGVVTNGTAVLGLGDIGPLAGKPVMEGKGCLFKKFAGIDVFDIELAEKDPDKLIEIIAALEPTLGGINLEDIKAPECFHIERALKERMKIPVFHDDQHGTAIISGAALLNGLELVRKPIGEIKLVSSGAGAAAIACLDVMVGLGVRRENIFVVDSRGVIQHERADAREGKLDESKQRYCQKTAARTLADVMKGADVFLGCSTAGVLTPDMVRTMGDQPIILALANPEPEIRPELARQAKPDCIVATGRSDYPNQVNNVLCFPYIFRGALDCGATRITEEMKLACVREIAALAKAEISDEVASAYIGQELRFGPEYLIPKPFDSRLILRIAPAVAKAAADSGVATRPIADIDAYRQSLTRFVYQTGMVMRPVFAAAKACPARVVYAEGEEERVLRAVQVVLDEGLAKPILIGRPAVMQMRLERAGLRMRMGQDFEVVNPDDDPRYRAYWEDYQQMMGREGGDAAVEHADRLHDAAPWRRRCAAHRAGRPLRPPSGARGRGDRAAQRRAGLCRDERADARRPHAVPHRHLRQRGAERAGVGRDRADGGGRGASLRPAAEGGVSVPLELRVQHAAGGPAHARGHAALPRARARRGMRRRDARRCRAVGRHPASLPAGDHAERRGQPAGAAQPRRGEHPVQRAEDDRRPRHHDRAGAAGRSAAGAHPHAVGHGTAHREHDGLVGGRRGGHGTRAVGRRCNAGIIRGSAFRSPHGCCARPRSSPPSAPRRRRRRCSSA